MNENTKPKNKRLLTEIIIIASLVLISVVAVIITVALHRQGAYAVVSVGGEVVAEYSLSDDGEYEINGGTNILRIENGAAYMIYANCPDGTCKRGSIGGEARYVGQSITCLPNRVQVVITGETQGGVDLVS